MEISAISHRTTDQYSYALDETTLCISLQTGLDIKEVYIVQGDPYIGLSKSGNGKWDGQKVELTTCVRLPHHQWWSIDIVPPYKRLMYYFIIVSEDETLLYFEDGFHSEEEFANPQYVPQYFMYSWLHPSDVNRIPAWVKETIWYQIFPDRFARIEKGNEQVAPWNRVAVSNEQRYGGNLAGIQSHLPYLQELGITGIYFNPLFLAPSNHKYDTQDYRIIDPLFGTMEEFNALVKEAHTRGIRVMLDCSFNHCGEKFAPWQDVCQKGKASIYYDWFMMHEEPFTNPEHPETSYTYDMFAFEKNMPKLNTNHPDVIQYVIDVCSFWAKEYQVDAFRLDVIDETSHIFTKALRKAMNHIDPDIFLLGEIWHDAMPWLRGDELHSVMNYPFQTLINQLFINETKTSENFAMEYHQIHLRYMRQTSTCLFNLLDSHDTDRIYHRFHQDEAKVLQALTILMSVQGSPCIYYGSEVLLDGSFDPDCRRCMPWDDLETKRGKAMFTYVQSLILLRKQNISLREGTIQFIKEENPRVLHYQKRWQGEVMDVILNLSSIPCAYRTSTPLFQYRYEQYQLHPGGILIF